MTWSELVRSFSRSRSPPLFLFLFLFIILCLVMKIFVLINSFRPFFKYLTIRLRFLSRKKEKQFLSIEEIVQWTFRELFFLLLPLSLEVMRNNYTGYSLLSYFQPLIWHRLNTNSFLLLLPPEKDNIHSMILWVQDHLLLLLFDKCVLHRHIPTIGDHSFSSSPFFFSLPP